jgi:hypothetical protein
MQEDGSSQHEPDLSVGIQTTGTSGCPKHRMRVTDEFDAVDDAIAVLFEQDA